MIQFISSIWNILKDSVVGLIELIISIPSYFTSYRNSLQVINLFNDSIVTNLLIIIVSIGLLIKIKRLII